jgi:hypothetical protein
MIFKIYTRMEYRERERANRYESERQGLNSYFLSGLLFSVILTVGS